MNTYERTHERERERERERNASVSRVNETSANLRMKTYIDHGFKISYVVGLGDKDLAQRVAAEIFS